MKLLCAALLGVMIQAASAGQIPSPTAVVNGHRPSRSESSPPEVTTVPIPAIWGAFAIWGSTGQDSRGHVWFGVTIEAEAPSAHLFEYIPQTRQLIDRGNVVDELKRAGIWRPGEQQAKIHSKIVQGPDNCLYFASMDEKGEHDDGSRLPTWGGHLWRLRLATNRWEHLLTTPEALIAVSGGSRFIYSLGYFGHVLYRYDVTAGIFKHVEVGSVDGHISRNLLSDYRGHVYVPRLRASAAAGGGRTVRVTLVELSSDLQELKETPIENDHYIFQNNPTGSHGITGLQEMDDQSIFFTTHVGFLYHVVPPARVPGQPINQSPAEVLGVGWFHPDGSHYVASLFTPDGKTALSGVAQLDEGGKHFEWVTCDIAGNSCGVAPLSLPAGDPHSIGTALLYGSSTRDAQGGHYVVGNIFDGANNFRPIILRVQPQRVPGGG